MMRCHGTVNCIPQPLEWGDPRLPRGPPVSQVPTGRECRVTMTGDTGNVHMRTWLISEHLKCSGLGAPEVRGFSSGS